MYVYLWVFGCIYTCIHTQPPPPTQARSSLTQSTPSLSTPGVPEILLIPFRPKQHIMHPAPLQRKHALLTRNAPSLCVFLFYFSYVKLLETHILTPPTTRRPYVSFFCF